MFTNDTHCLPANPEFSGVGIRVAIYTQNFLSFITAFYALSDGKVTIAGLSAIEAQSFTILVTAFSILISAIAKGLAGELSNVHAAIILNLSWMSNTILFIYILLYLHHTAAVSGSNVTTWGWQFWWNAMWKSTGRDIPKDVAVEQKARSTGGGGWVGWRSRVLRSGKSHDNSNECKTPNMLVLLLGMVHLSLMAIAGVWLWTNPSTFDYSLSRPCPVPPSLVVLGHTIPITSNGLQGLSIAMYSLVIVPLFSIFIPMALVISFHIWFNRRYRNTLPENTFFAKVISLLSPRSPFANAEPKKHDVFPISVCLVLLATINVVFVADTEATLIGNRDLQEAGGSDWTFGQTLAIFLLLIPLRDVLKSFMQRQERKVRDRIETISELEGARLGLQDKDGSSPIFRAVLEGHLDVVEYLGGKGEYFDLQDQDGNSLLHQATIGGHLHIVKYLGDKKVQLDVQDKNGNSPLHQATIRGHLDIVKHLGDRGAQPDLQDKNGNSPLHQATIRGYLDIVKYLVDKGAQLDLQDENGNSPLHQATIRGYLEIVKYLGDKGAKLDLQDKYGNSPLHQATIRGYLGIVKYLGDNGSQLDLQDENGNSPLHQATIRGYSDIIKYLGDKGALLDLQDRNGNSLLHQATIRGYLVIIKYLGDKGAQLDLQDENGNSPLHQAALRGYLDIVKYLGDKGANLDLQDKHGNSPLHQATIRGYLSIVKYLEDKGAQLNLQDENGNSPIHQATIRGYLDIVKYLGDKGAILDLQDTNGTSPLHQATFRGNLGIVKYLGDNRAQPNLQDRNGCSPLHLAASGGHSRIVEYLRDKVAQLHMQDRD